MTMSPRCRRVPCCHPGLLGRDASPWAGAVPALRFSRERGARTGRGGGAAPATGANRGGNERLERTGDLKPQAGSY